MLKALVPARLVRLPAPTNHPEVLYELKLDGFRAVAYLKGGTCELVSRNGNTYRSKKLLALGRAIAAALPVRDAILDGELVCLDAQGTPQFYDLLYRRGEPSFYAFDLLWLNGRDLSGRPLVEQKRALRRTVPAEASPVRYLDHVHEKGIEVRRRDLKGIVAKLAAGPYVAGDSEPLSAGSSHDS